MKLNRLLFLNSDFYLYWWWLFPSWWLAFFYLPPLWLVSLFTMRADTSSDWRKSHVLWFYWARTRSNFTLWFLWSFNTPVDNTLAAFRFVSRSAQYEVHVPTGSVLLCPACTGIGAVVKGDGGWLALLGLPSCQHACQPVHRLKADTVRTVLIGTAAAQAGVRVLALFSAGWQTT